jgi:hypothetical protein
MKQLVIMPGGFHPFHAGHLALYQSAEQAFPGADIKVAATNDTSGRPFPFALKEKLAQLAGVPPGNFYQVNSPFRAEEITKSYDPDTTQLIFVRSEKDQGKSPMPAAIDPATGQLPLVTRGANKGKPVSNYLQYYSGNQDQPAPMTQHAYMAYLPTVEFGPGMTSATEIRSAWPTLNEKRKTALVMSLYPATQSNPKLAATVVKMLDTAMGTQDVAEAGKKFVDPELAKAKQYAKQHYPGMADPESAFDKWVTRSLMHSDRDDHDQDKRLQQLAADIAAVKTKIQALQQNADYLDESR